MKRYLGAAALATLIAVTPMAINAAEHAPFMVGILSSDGVLIPLAHFSAGKWTAPWPDDDRAAPASVAQVPEAWWPSFSKAPWRIARAEGDRPLQVVKPVKVQSGCEHVVGLKTDWPAVDERLSARHIGIAATGSVVVRFVKTIGVNDPKDDDWKAGETKLRHVLALMKRPMTGLRTTLVARIPRQDGSDVWEVEAVADKRFVRLWFSDAKSEHFVMVSDSVTDADRETVGSITPLGAIWGLDRMTVLAWDQGYDGGRFAIIRLAAEGIDWALSAGGGLC